MTKKEDQIILYINYHFQNKVQKNYFFKITNLVTKKIIEISQNLAQTTCKTHYLFTSPKQSKVLIKIELYQEFESPTQILCIKKVEQYLSINKYNNQLKLDLSQSDENKCIVQMIFLRESFERRKNREKIVQVRDLKSNYNREIRQSEVQHLRKFVNYTNQALKNINQDKQSQNEQIQIEQKQQEKQSQQAAPQPSIQIRKVDIKISNQAYKNHQESQSNLIVKPQTFHRKRLSYFRMNDIHHQPQQKSVFSEKPQRQEAIQKSLIINQIKNRRQSYKRRPSNEFKSIKEITISSEKNLQNTSKRNIYLHYQPNNQSLQSPKLKQKKSQRQETQIQPVIQKSHQISNKYKKRHSQRQIIDQQFYEFSKRQNIVACNHMQAESQNDENLKSRLRYPYFASYQNQDQQKNEGKLPKIKTTLKKYQDRNSLPKRSKSENIVTRSSKDKNPSKNKIYLTHSNQPVDYISNNSKKLKPIDCSRTNYSKIKNQKLKNKYKLKRQ